MLEGRATLAVGGACAVVVFSVWGSAGLVGGGVGAGGWLGSARGRKRNHPDNSFDEHIQRHGKAPHSVSGR